MTINPSKAVAALTIATLLLGLAGCTDKASPDNLDRRSVERWNYLIAHEAEKAYDYLTPGFRATQTREVYASQMNTRPVQWKSARFDGKQCEAQRCTVRVEVAYSLVIPGMGGKPAEASSIQQETWIFTNGDWYFLPK